MWTGGVPAGGRLLFVLSKQRAALRSWACADALFAALWPPHNSSSDPPAWYSSCRQACCTNPLCLPQLQGIITLWPRQSYSNDLDYLHRYFSSAPAGSGLRCYNDIQNEAYEASERPGWRHYQPPVAEVKPLLAASIAYTFPAEEDNLRLFRSCALEVAALWAAFLQQGGCPAKDPGALHRFDGRHFSCITTDPGNNLAVKLFGEPTTDKLLKMATGHPAVAS
jgi:hypothetical protein